MIRWRDQGGSPRHRYRHKDEPPGALADQPPADHDRSVDRPQISAAAAAMRTRRNENPPAGFKPIEGRFQCRLEPLRLAIAGDDPDLERDIASGW